MDAERLAMTSSPSIAEGTIGTSTRSGLTILAAAVALGASGDALLRVGPPGANAAVWLGAFLTILLVLRRRLTVETASGAAIATGIALAFALGLAWRDAMAIKLLDLAVVGTMVALAFLRLLDVRVRSVGVGKLVAAGTLAGLHAAFAAPVLLAGDVHWREVRRTRRATQALAAVRGLAIAAPLLVIFGALLAAADAIFAHILTDVLRIDIEAMTSHLLLAGFLAWVVGGVLRGALLTRPVAGSWRDLSRLPRLGVVEVGIVLGLLDLLLLGFVVVQARYLFGGAGYLGSLPVLSYAEYARHGFFELVGVAALAIPVLLLTDWLLRRDRERDERVYRALAAVMALLLTAVMASALRRMLLYTGEYGLSELRVYTLAFMGWLALVLAWFWLTVLRGRRERFACGALIAGVAVVAVLNLGNVDGVIARVNLARAASGRFDARHAASLSADAIPTLIAGLPNLDDAQRATVVTALKRRWELLRVSDWRDWSASRAAALRALEAGPAVLREPAPAAASPRRGCAGR